MHDGVLTSGFDDQWHLALLVQLVEQLDDVGLCVWRVEDFDDLGAMRLVLWTPEAERATGVAGSDCLGQTLREAFPPLVDTPLPAAYAEVARTGVAADLGDVHYGDDRVAHATYHLRLVPLPDRCVGILLSNVTQRRAVEAERREAEARYTDLFENAYDLIQSVAPDGTLRYANRAWLTTFGYDESETDSLNIFELIHPDSQPHCRDLFQRLMTGEVIPHIEADFVTRDGGRITLQGAVSVRFGDDGHPVETRAIFRDVTERRELDRLKDEFVSTVSHELRTPLTSIRGSLGLVEGGLAGELPQKAQELISIARSNTDRLIRLINDILDLEKLAAGRLELRQQEINVEALVRSACENVAGMAATRDVVVDQPTVPAIPGRVIGDYDRLTQVLTNLLSNAIKYTPAGDHVRIAVEALPGAHAFTIAVSDAGPGISAADRELIFERFRQADGSDKRSEGGTGLGLAIAREIIDQHGGALLVGDADGGGACFTVRLALRPDAPAPVADGTSVLVVEDDPSLSELLCELLRHAGHATTPAATLAEARAIVAEVVPRAVLLDMRLPDGSGLQFLEELRADARTAEVPVVVVTGSETEPGNVESLDLADWIRKPFAPPALMASVRRALHGADRAQVLVIEDDEGTRRVLAETLRSAGLDVLEAADGAHALRLSTLHRPDLIVLDVELPLLDGFALVERLREGEAASTPLIVYSGRDLAADERQRLTLGITRHLTKGRVAPEALLASVVSALGAGRGPATS